jgi:hypothetical protein
MPHTVQEWHSTREAVMEDHQSNRDDRRIRQGTKLQEEPKKDEHSQEDNRHTMKASMEAGTETSRNS